MFSPTKMALSFMIVSNVVCVTHESVSIMIKRTQKSKWWWFSYEKGESWEVFSLPSGNRNKCFIPHWACGTFPSRYHVNACAIPSSSHIFPTKKITKGREWTREKWITLNLLLFQFHKLFSNVPSYFFIIPFILSRIFRWKSSSCAGR